MSRKHNTQHIRSRSHYGQRLADRGLSKAPTMQTVEHLRYKQVDKETGRLKPEYRPLRERNRWGGE